MDKLLLVVFSLIGYVYTDQIYQEDLVPSFIYEFADTIENHTYTCAPGDTLRGPFCYSVSSTPLSWDLASPSCMAFYNYRLAEPTNVYENIHLASLAQDNGLSQFWIGLTAKNSTYGTWSGGRQAEVAGGSQWAANEPKFSRGDCVGIEVASDGSYGWKMFDCDTLLPYVCFGRAFEEELFRCEDNSQDIPYSMVCDTIADCEDSSDEKNCGTCAEELEGVGGIISSGSPYTAKQFCSWSILGPLSHIIHLKFDNFYTEPWLDFMRVYSGGVSEVEGELVATYSGSLGQSKEIYSSNNMMFLTFLTDSTREESGFNITWTAISMADLCQLTLTATDNPYEFSSDIDELESGKQNFSSPFYPNKYIKNLDCKWTIEAEDPNSFVTLQFDMLSIGADTIRVTDGSGLDAPVVATLTGDGSEQLWTIISSGRSLVVYFTTSSHQVNKGFQAKFWQGCRSIVYRNFPGFVQSPGYGVDGYSNRLNCSWIFLPSPGEIVITYFKPSEIFNLDDSVAGFEDTLKMIDNDTFVFTGSNRSDLAGFGEFENIFEVRFETGLTVTSDGFRGHLDESRACIEELIPTEVPFSVEGYSFFNQSDGTFRFDNVSCLEQGSMFLNEEFLEQDTISLICKSGRYNINHALLCSVYYCGAPPVIENGYIRNITGLRAGDTVTYGCYPEFTQFGEMVSTCGGDGWGQPPNCTVVGCPAISIPENGNSTLLNGDGTSVGSVYEFICDTGYTIRGDSRLLCGQSGWSALTPNCTEIMCAVPGIPFGRLSTNRPAVPLGTVLSAVCDPGFEQLSDNVTMCESDMRFDNSLQCVDIDECALDIDGCSSIANCTNTIGSFYCECPDDYELDVDNRTCIDFNECAENNGTGPCDQICTNTDGGYTCSCDPGFTLYTENGTNNIYLRNGSMGYSELDILYLDHTCVPDPCIAFIPDTIENGTVIIPRSPKYPQYLREAGMYFPGERVDFHCEMGYAINGGNDVTASIFCLSDLNFDRSVPTCEPALCTDPCLSPFPEFAEQLPDLSGFEPVPYGERSLLPCDMGRPSTVYMNRTCSYSMRDLTYKLYGDFDYCPVIDCGEPEMVAGGNYTAPEKNWYGYSFEFTCQTLIEVDGASKQGDNIVRCQESGNWDFGSLTCLTATCKDPGRPADGYQNATSYEVGSLVTFGCERPGFELTDPYPLECIIDIGSNNVMFNGSVPSCVDTEAPVFPSCPSSPIIVERFSSANGSSLIPDDVIATDNSGLIQYYTKTPTNFEPFRHLFSEDKNVTYTAFDAAANSAECIVEFVIQDTFSPILTCEPRYVYLENETDSVTVTFDYAFISGSVSVIEDKDSVSELAWLFDPPVVTFTWDMEHYGTIIEVIAIDKAGNEGFCAMNVVPKEAVCSAFSLPLGVNATYSCNEVLGVTECDVSCSSGFFGNFEEEDLTTLSYTCNNGVWSSTPYDYPTSKLYCVAPSSYAESSMVFKTVFNVLEFEANYAANYDWDPNDITAETIENCTANYYMPFIEGKYIGYTTTFNAFVNTIYPNPPKTLTLDLSYELDGERFILYTRYNVSVMTNTDQENIQNVIEPYFTATLSDIPGLLDAAFDLPSFGGGACPHVVGTYKYVNWTHECFERKLTLDSNDYFQCVPCPPGSFYSYDTGLCMLCPNNTYQEEPGQLACNSCPAGTSTAGKTGVYLESECYDLCDVDNGLVSDTGAYPCRHCPIGSIPTAADECSPCEGTLESNSTVYPVFLKDEFIECKAACGAGRFSPTGYEPCESLPRGFYSTEGVSYIDSPEECADEETTANVGSTSQADCQPSSSCDSSPCANGNCVEVFHSFSCSCLANAGFTGSLCEFEVYPCDSSPCYNGGACMDTGLLGYNCSCPEGFNGTNCEIEPDDCINNDCLNGAMCKDGDGTFTCLCPSSGVFIGEKCNNTEDICSAQPCSAQGTCVPLSETRRECVCDPGYTRSNCEFNIKECWSRPCLNGGTCNDGIDSYTCDCPTNFYGEQCQYRTNPCDSMDCGTGNCFDKFSYNMGQCICSKYTESSECKMTYYGLEYLGKVNVTVSGKTCQRWDAQAPHTHRVKRLPSETLAEAENYCRQTDFHAANSGGYGGPWCFTTDPSVRWESCDIPLCPGRVAADPIPNIDCRVSSRGWQYYGNVSTTKSGIECQRWDSQSPHAHTRQTQWRNFPEHMRNLSYAENFCRQTNKLGGGLPYCYTSNENVTMEDCDIPLCPSNSIDDTCTPFPLNEYCQYGTYIPDPDIGFYCLCEPGYEGSNCATLIDNCEGGPCVNGDCTSSIGSFTCTCDDGWDGPTCSNMIDLCQTDCNLAHASACTPLPNDFLCECIDGFSGRACNIPINWCDAEPCLNGGTCSDAGSANYTCSCAAGWTGEHCETLEDRCSPNPCANGAQCVPLINDYYCVCPDGLFGKDCGDGQNVSFCDLGACLNGGACSEIGNDVYCNCTYGFTGEGCQVKIDLCLPDNEYCYNGGSCSYPDYDNATCECLPGYTGLRCEDEIDECVAARDSGECPVNATCLDYTNGFYCTCPIGVIGEDCLKAVDGDFDLHFTLPDRSATARSSAPVNIIDASVLSVMFHMRYQFNDDTGTFLTIYTGTLESPMTQKAIEMTDEGIVMHLANGGNQTMAYNFPINQDGQWHHLGVNYYPDIVNPKVTMYYDTTYQEINLDDMLDFVGIWATVQLGGDFIGYISQVNMWKRELDLNTDILPADSLCSSPVDTTDLLVEWGKFNLNRGVKYVYPAKCDSETFITEEGTFSWYTRDGYLLDTDYVILNETGLTLGQCRVLCQDRIVARLQCRSISHTDNDGSGNSVCLINSATAEEVQRGVAPPRARRSVSPYTYMDVIATLGDSDSRAGPVLVSCPDEIVISSPERTTFVSWDEPVFTNARLVQSNYMSGSPFTWGVHQVTYVAESASLVKAYCAFTVTVSYWDCLTTYPDGVDPDVCYTEGDTGICDLSCALANQTTCLPSPLILTCSPCAGWDQTYPLSSSSESCTDIQPRIIEVHGFLTYPITAQTEAVKTTLIQRTTKVFTDLNTYFPGFCAASDCSDLSIVITYNPGQNATVEFGLPASDGIFTSTDNILSMNAFDIVTKALFIDNDFTFTPAASAITDISIPEATVNIGVADLQEMVSCSDGQALTDDGCIICCAGSYYNATLVQCIECDYGYYQDMAAQTTCNACDPGETTELMGATSEDACKASCSAGSFYNVTAEACEPCGHGFYQGEEGQFYCNNCGPGQSTRDVGSTNRTLCFDQCPSGTQIGISGNCEDCPRGTYRTTGIQFTCTPCPLGFITPTAAALSILECTIADCQSGEYRNSTTNTCEMCPLDTYQPEKWQDECIECSAGNGTMSTGSNSLSDCQPICSPGFELDGSCTECDIGFYNPSRFGSCLACPAGTLTAGTGAIDMSMCSLVDCPSGFEDYNGTCVGCVIGTYRDSGDGSGAFCQTCPIGKTTLMVNSTSLGDCIDECVPGFFFNIDNSSCEACPPGTYQNETLAFECIECPLATYSSALGASSNTTCNLCEPGFVTMETASTSPENCTYICPDGFEWNSVNQTCDSCPRGTYRNATLDPFGECSPCPFGFITALENSTSLDDCSVVYCPPGAYTNTSGAGCILCPFGTYQPLAQQFDCLTCPPGDGTEPLGAIELVDCGSSCDIGYEGGTPGVCTPCEAGYYKNYIGRESCSPCPHGSFSNITGLGNASECIPCPPGYTTNTTASTISEECLPGCNPGFYFDEDNATCYACPLGFFQPDPFQTECHECSNGTTTQMTGSTSRSQCIKSCPPGEENIAEVCVICGFAFYKPGDNANPCLPCPTGKLSGYKGAESADECSADDCPSGTEYREDRCLPTEIGFYRDADADTGPSALACPPEFITDGTGAITIAECNVANCSAGFYRFELGNTCLPCPVGTYQPNKWRADCDECPIHTTTADRGNTSPDDCYSTDECALGTHNCSMKADCINTEESFYCECVKYFTGDGFTCDHVCDVDYCKNSGLCQRDSDTDEPTCYCSEVWEGPTCEIRIQPSDMQTVVIIASVIGGVVGFILFIFVIIGCLSAIRGEPVKDVLKVARWRRKNPLLVTSPAVYGGTLTGKAIPTLPAFMPPTTGSIYGGSLGVPQESMLMSVTNPPTAMFYDESNFARPEYQDGSVAVRYNPGVVPSVVPSVIPTVVDTGGVGVYDVLPEGTIVYR